MKQPVKLLLALLGIVCIIILAYFGWSAKAKSDATFHLANGIEVTPIEIKPDDITTALDGRIWKFDVHLPDSDKIYNYSLILCQHGKFVRPLAGFGTGPVKVGDGNPNAQITIGMVPIDDTFGRARQIKYNLHINSGTGTLGTFANPFKEDGGYTADVQASEPDNLIYLMSGKKSGGSSLASENDTNIALKIEPWKTK